MTVAFACYLVRFLLDWTCAPFSQICRKGSELFSHIYAVVICFLLIIAFTKAKQFSELLQRVKAAAVVLNADNAKAKLD